ncbi:MAG: anti-sigma factor antagonist [Atopobiaceae bacterium]|nr:anti-sigma factor antagonist [Atopobiaceae bacterium]
MTNVSNIALVPVETDIDVTTVAPMRASLDRLIDGGCRRIVLNMSGVSFIDSAGMAMLLFEIRRMRALGGLLSLTDVSNEVLALFRRARLVDYVPVSCCASRRKAGDPDPSVLPLWRTVVPIDGNDLTLTRAQIAQLIRQVPLSQDESFDALLAAGEAVGNAVDHTDGSDALVTISGYSDRVVIEVSDSGPGFDPEEVCCDAQDDCSERGRGIRIMNLLADSVTIARKPCGPGMNVRIVKRAHALTD